MIFSEGKQLSSSNAQKILLARSIINKPRLLFYEDPTDKMDEIAANEIIDFILSVENPWTVIVCSKNKNWKNKTTREIILKEGTIYKDIKK
jgi:ABC-type lipoprotein export system ATPase subunit